MGGRNQASYLVWVDTCGRTGQGTALLLSSGSSGSIQASTDTTLHGRGRGPPTAPHVTSTHTWGWGQGHCHWKLVKVLASAWSALMPPWQWHSGIPHHCQVQKEVQVPRFVVADSSGVGLRCFLWCFLLLYRGTASFCWLFSVVCLFFLFVPLVLLDCWLLQHTVQDRWSKRKPRHIITVSFLGSQGPLLICLLLSAFPEFSCVVVYIMPKVLVLSKANREKYIYSILVQNQKSNKGLLKWPFLLKEHNSDHVSTLLKNLLVSNTPLSKG